MPAIAISAAIASKAGRLVRSDWIERADERLREFIELVPFVSLVTAPDEADGADCLGSVAMAAITRRAWGIFVATRLAVGDEPTLL